MAYGETSDVGALTPAYTISGDFTANTHPTGTQVGNWLDQVSDILDTYLAEAGFTVPITVATESAKMLVTGAVADLCHFANNAGRFYTERALEIGFNPINVISREIARWVEQHAEGLEKRGEERTSGGLSDIATRDIDEAGDTIEPIFQRKAFGNKVDDWDN